ncbi:methyl-accepting chemotaxis protein [Gracilibacillus caseinilyticus]|uniref:Methyl-accepting chemotaxis protein n=1 Tax=Gracilibacillus caseinilyticus TaxID=2932256 RepID=A0ABY4EX78_9BACI|nr:methyl-accepting chemotaxis protein [Gracilibacillus caseinilyticus]UOQ48889.1 methyl-accepting chemotaxis protein [Gracilibacillus caseinilyticus]
MKKFIQNRKISTKLYAIVSLAIAIYIISGAIFIGLIVSVTNGLEQQLYDRLYQTSSALLNADRDMYQADQAFITSFVDTENSEEYKSIFAENVSQVEERLALTEEKLMVDPNVDKELAQNHFATFSDNFEAWKEEATTIMNSGEVTNELLTNLRVEFDTARNKLDLLQQELDETAEKSITAIDQIIRYFWIIAVVVILLISAVLFMLSFFLIRQITKPINQLVIANDQISEGNLNIEWMEDNRKDEIGSLAKSTNLMVDELKKMVRQIQEISAEVNGQSREMSQSSDQVSQGSHQIATTMEEMSYGAEQQAGASSDISGSIESLHRKIAASSAEGEALQHASEEVLELSVTSGSQLNDSVEQMQEITSMMQTTVTKVQSLEKQSSKISTLIDVIQNIAEQTNLLALNAAIEAARAGDSGKGFAVVADEVRKLAEQVSQSVTEITGIIGGLQSETKDVANVLEGGYSTVEYGNKTILQSQESFQQIQSQMSGMIDRIGVISTNMFEIQQSSEKVSEASTDIASTSEELAAGIQESSATAEQQSSSMQEIASNAEHLAKLSDDLNELTRKFSI